MRSNYLLISAGALALSMSSCTFFGNRQAPAPVAPAGPQVTDPANQTVSSDAQKTVRKKRDAVSSSSSTSTEAATPKPPSPTPEVKKTDYRYAIQIPGKEGFVFNPYTNNPVDVRGIPSGTLVRDPQDTNVDHKFRVP